MKTRLQKMIRTLLLLSLPIVIIATSDHALAGERKLSFAVSGVVESISITPGASVKSGTVLAVLDQTTFLARKRAADAAVESTKLILDLADLKSTQVRELFDALSTSQEEVEKAEIALANARSAYEAASSHAEIAHWRLQRATLISPFEGTVASIPGYPGMVINTYAGLQAVVVVNAK
ncbi:MAG: biotin/lipoyl-binding protein [Rhodospirillales bacterium]|nr:biotin/lipoyl-binding protein [Rhodospirillales bacterium]